MSAAFDGWSIVSRRTLACQYGSLAELAIIVPRQFAPIDTSSPAGDTRLLWQAMQSVESANMSVFGACGARVATGAAGAGSPWRPSVEKIRVPSHTAGARKTERR